MKLENAIIISEENLEEGQRAKALALAGMMALGGLRGAKANAQQHKVNEPQRIERQDTQNKDVYSKIAYVMDVDYKGIPDKIKFMRNGKWTTRVAWQYKDNDNKFTVPSEFDDRFELSVGKLIGANADGNKSDYQANSKAYQTQEKTGNPKKHFKQGYQVDDYKWNMQDQNGHWNVLHVRQVSSKTPWLFAGAGGEGGYAVCDKIIK